jgi:hypothetical protein
MPSAGPTAHNRKKNQEHLSFDDEINDKNNQTGAKSAWATMSLVSQTATGKTDPARTSRGGGFEDAMEEFFVDGRVSA